MSDNEKQVLPISDEVLHRIVMHQLCWPDEQIIFTAEEAAARIGVSLSGLKQIVRNGDIPVFTVGPGRRHIYFLHDIEMHLCLMRFSAEVRLAGGYDKYRMKHGRYRKEEEPEEE